MSFTPTPTTAPSSRFQVRQNRADSTTTPGVTSTAASSQRSNAPASLYLIVFLTVFLLLIFVALIVVARRHVIRRRLRREVEQAVTRGDLTEDRGDQILRRLAGTSWGIGRVSNTWATLLAEEPIGPGHWPGRNGGRRKKKAKNYGPPPILHEFDLQEKADREGSGAMAVEDVLHFQPFSLYYPKVANAPEITLQQAIASETSGTAPQPTPSSERERRHFGMRAWPTSLFGVHHPPPTPTPETHTYPPSASLLEASASSPIDGSETKPKADIWIEQITELHPQDYPLEASFLIRMPESEWELSAREKLKEEEGEEMLHCPMEVAIWTGVLTR